MSHVTRIKGGTIWTEKGPVVGDVVIDQHGRIQDVRAEPPSDGSMPLDPTGEIDASGLWVIPGAVDVHVHFREPGLTDKEDFMTGSAAAAVGGVTTVLDMPNTLPPVTNGSLLRQKKEGLAGRSYVDYGLFGCLTAGEVPGAEDVAWLIDQVEAMLQEGACGIKIFMGPTTGDIRSPGFGTLYQVCKHFASTDVIFTFHCEDRESIEVSTSMIQSAKGSLHKYQTLLDARPRFGELIATDAALRLALETGAKVHIAHVALKEAVWAIERAKAAGARVSAETCPQYLLLTDEDYPVLGEMMKVLPPIRHQDDQDVLWEGLRSGIIDCVATDHAPHQRSVGQAPVDPPSALTGPFGCAGVETMLPLMLHCATSRGISVDDVVKWCATHPADIYHLSGKGRLSPGADADIVLIDPRIEWIIEDATWRSKSNNTPFWGLQLKGKPVLTLSKGRVIAQDGQVVGAPIGSFLHSSHDVVS